MKKLPVLLGASIAAFISGQAFAAGDIVVTDSGDEVEMELQVTIDAACTHLATQDVNWGSHAQGSAEYVETVDVTVSCSSGTAYTVEIDYGQNAFGTTERQLASADSGLTPIYKLFKPDATGAATEANGEWGLTADAREYDNTGTGVDQTLTATARVFVENEHGPGTYEDLVVVRLCFAGPCP